MARSVSDKRRETNVLGNFSLHARIFLLVRPTHNHSSTLTPFTLRMKTRNEKRAAKAIIECLKRVDDMSRRVAVKPGEDREVAFDELNPLRCSRGLCECNEATNMKCAYRAALLGSCACWGNVQCLYHKHATYRTRKCKARLAF